MQPEIVREPEYDDPGRRRDDPEQPPHRPPDRPGPPPGRGDVRHGGREQRDDQQFRRDQRVADAVVGHAGCRAARFVVATSTSPATSSAVATTIHTTS